MRRVCALVTRWVEILTWPHISDISSKATKTLGFLRRNLVFAPRGTKEVAYKTLVRPKLEYAAPTWSPYCKSGEGTEDGSPPDLQEVAQH